jgi:hypothetical protein
MDGQAVGFRLYGNHTESVSLVVFALLLKESWYFGVVA